MFKRFIKINFPNIFKILSRSKMKILIFNLTIYKFLNNFYYFRKINYKLNPTFKKFTVYNYLNNNSVFIDIGANIGLYSLFISDNYKSNIICFEPHPKAFKILSARLGNNKKIKIYNKAVSDENGYTDLYLHQEEGSTKQDYSESSSLFSQKINVDPNKKIKIETIDINRILNNYDYIDCIKINAEGVEFKILSQIIKNHKKIGKVFCAFHNEKIKGVDKVYLEIMDELNKKNLLNNWFYEME